MLNFLITLSDFFKSLATSTGISFFNDIGDMVRGPADKVLTAKSKITEHKVRARATMSQAQNVKGATQKSPEQKRKEEEQQKKAA